MESEDTSLKFTPFPALSKQAKATIGNIETEVTSSYFADKILITISQSGRLTQWIEVPTGSSITAPLMELGYQNTAVDSLENGDDLVLPAIHLTPKTLLGGGGEQRENMGHLLANHVTNSITTRNPDESRTVLVGLGLEKDALKREDFFDMMELLHSII